MNILVVDDETAALSDFFSEVLDDPAFTYKMLRDPETALAYAEGNPIDAAFLDINMPKLNGVALAERLIALYPNIQIVFISGYAHNESDIAARLGENLKGFCRKPYTTDMLYLFLHRLSTHNTVVAEAKTFGLFDIALHGKPIRFSCAKSKELLAVLIDKEGAHVPLDTAIALLWPDKPPNLSKRLYRDAVIRLKLTLKAHGIDDLVYFYRAELALNRNRLTCDLYTALTQNDLSAYFGEYMTQYAEWSQERQAALDGIRKKEV